MSHVTHVAPFLLSLTSVHKERSRIHIWMSHIAHVNVSCHTCECVMSHMWMCHIAHVNESCLMDAWGMSHIWKMYVTHINDSHHSCEWVMSQIWMGHVIHMNESVGTTFVFFQTRTLAHLHTLSLIHSHTLTPSHSHTLTTTHSHTLTLPSLTLSHSFVFGSGGEESVVGIELVWVRGGESKSESVSHEWVTNFTREWATNALCNTLLLSYNTRVSKRIFVFVR